MAWSAAGSTWYYTYNSVGNASIESWLYLNHACIYVYGAAYQNYGLGWTCDWTLYNSTMIAGMSSGRMSSTSTSVLPVST